MLPLVGLEDADLSDVAGSDREALPAGEIWLVIDGRSTLVGGR